MPTGPFTLRELAEAAGGTLEGDAGKRIRGVAPLESAGPDEITFVSNPKYLQKALESKPGAILAAPGTELPGLNVIRVKEPYLAMARLLQRFHPVAGEEPGVRPGAMVEPGAEVHPDAAVLSGAHVASGASIGAGTVLHPGVTVGSECRVGSACVIHPNVTLYPGSVIGDRVILHAGVVIGSDGFGFAHDSGTHVKIPQIGNAVIEDDVEIGANSTVDRATFGSTVIGRGSKIDNLVQVAHNVVLGPGCILVAQSGIAGSTTLGKGVIIAGQSGTVGHITLGDGVKVGAKSAVTRDLKDGEFVIGHPAMDAGTWKRAVTAFGRLPEILRRLASMERATGLADERGGPEPDDEGTQEG